MIAMIAVMVANLSSAISSIIIINKCPVWITLSRTLSHFIDVQGLRRLYTMYARTRYIYELLEM